MNADAMPLWYLICTRLFMAAKEGNPREFLRWEIINSTMHMPNRIEFSKWYDYLKKLDDWETRWSSAIKETPIGNPIPFLEDSLTSPELIQHAFHLAFFEKTMSLKTTDVDLVIEIGGGYGSMCRLFYNLGYRKKYLIYDLPPLTLLQTLYLRDLDIQVKCHTGHWDQVWCTSNIGDIQNAVDSFTENEKILLIGTWSLSECPINLRSELMNIVSEKCTSFLISYQEEFNGIDNTLYFDELKDRMDNIFWIEKEVPYHPNNHYMFGRKVQE